MVRIFVTKIPTFMSFQHHWKLCITDMPLIAQTDSLTASGTILNHWYTTLALRLYMRLIRGGWKTCYLTRKKEVSLGCWGYFHPTIWTDSYYIVARLLFHVVHFFWSDKAYFKLIFIKFKIIPLMGWRHFLKYGISTFLAVFLWWSLFN